MNAGKAILFTGIFAGAGYLAWKASEVVKWKGITSEIKNVKFKDIYGGKVRLDLVMKTNNPATITAPIDMVDLAVLINGKKVATIKEPGETPIKPGPGEVVFKAEIPVIGFAMAIASEAINVIASGATSYAAKVNIDGMLRLQKKAIVQYNDEFELPVPIDAVKSVINLFKK